jgi:hypothetical protein
MHTVAHVADARSADEKARRNTADVGSDAVGANGKTLAAKRRTETVAGAVCLSRTKQRRACGAGSRSRSRALRLWRLLRVTANTQIYATRVFSADKVATETDGAVEHKALVVGRRHVTDVPLGRAVLDTTVLCHREIDDWFGGRV